MRRTLIFIPLLLACGGGGPAGHDGGSDAAEDVVSDAGVVHPADAGPQVIITDDTYGTSSLLVFAPPLTDASAPLFKVTNIAPNVTASPATARVGPDGWTLWVADSANYAVEVFDLPLSPSSAPKQTVLTDDIPRDLRFDSKGDLFVAASLGGIEWWAPPINSLKPSGVIQQQTGYNIGALAIDSNDTLYADSNTNSILVFSDPTHQPNPTVFSTPGWGFAGLEIAQGSIYGIGQVSGLEAYALPLVSGEQATFVYNAGGGSRLSLSPSMDLVAPDPGGGRALLFAPPTYTSFSEIVPLPQWHPTSVAFFNPP